MKVRYKKPSAELTEMAAPKSVTATRASIGNEDMVSDVYSIQVQNLVPFQSQARRVFKAEEINSLAQTIQEYGVRQPLTVVKDKTAEEKYQVVSGERRLRAAIQAGLSRVPCVILHNFQKADEIAIIENIHRSDLHPVEAASAYNKLLETGKYLTQQELADKLSLKKSSVSEHLKLARLPQDIQEYLVRHDIRSRDVLRKLMSLDSSEEMKSFLNVAPTLSSQVISGGMKSISILRISLSEGNYTVQKKAMRLLSESQKKSLKEKLLEIASQLI